MTMDPLHWKQLRALYDEVVDVPLDERDDAIRRACGGDNALADDLRWMLQSNTEADAVVDGIVAEAASTLLETSLEGAQIGPYRLVSEIGQGGMSPSTSWNAPTASSSSASRSSSSGPS